MSDPELGTAHLPVSQVDALMGVMEDGQPFTVVFTKKNGDERTMLCSIDSTKAASMGGFVGNHTVWDREAERVKAFRSAFVVSISVP